MAEQDLNALIAELKNLNKELSLTKQHSSNAEQGLSKFIASARKWKRPIPQQWQQSFAAENQQLEQGRRYTVSPLYGHQFTATQKDVDAYNKVRLSVMAFDKQVLQLTTAVAVLRDRISSMPGGEQALLRYEVESELEAAYPPGRTKPVPARDPERGPEAPQKPIKKTEYQKELERAEKEAARKLKQETRERERVAKEQLRANVAFTDELWKSSQKEQRRWGKEVADVGGDPEALRINKDIDVAWKRHQDALNAYSNQLKQDAATLKNNVSISDAEWEESQRAQREWATELKNSARKQEKLNQEIQKETEKRVAEAAKMASFTQGNPELRGKLETLGFTPDKKDFRISQHIEPTSGITKTTAQYEELSGAIRRTTIVQNRHNKILNDTQKRYRDLTSAIARDITEVFKWTVAVGVVYGPLRKLQDLIQIAITNQAKLADIAVVLGKSQADLGEIFNAAADAAREMGEPLEGVIESYDLAYRAAGKYSDQAQRTSMATLLLRDSLLLSKLAGMEQADAMDVLVGALQQLGKELDYGDVLINKWVAVSRQANVSIKDLATSFGITATAAENVGLDVDQLNGLIATLATSMGSMSSSEVGNAIRAFVTGFQSEGAVNALQQFGISVTDTEGSTRDFLSVLEDVAELFQRGLISESQLNKLATALGGQGARRGPQMAAILLQLGQANELASVSAGATNEAYDALEVKLDTVETRVTNLANAFQQLAESLGENGGVLDVVSAVLDVAIVLVDTLTEVSDALGPLAPLFGVGAVGMFLANNSNKFDMSALTAGGRFGAKIKPPIQDVEGWAWHRQPLGGGLQAGALGVAALIPQLVSIASQAKKGENVGNELAATAIGGGLGFAAAGPVGAAVGAAIANVFVESVLEREGDFENFFNRTIKPGEEEVPTGTDVEQRFTEEMFTQYGEGNAAKGKLRATMEAGLANLITGVSGYLGLTEGLDKITPEQVALSNLKIGNTQGGLVTSDTDNENFYRLKKIEEQRKSSLGVTSEITSVFGQETEDVMRKNAAIIEQIIEDQRQKLIERVRDQEITSKEYLERLGQLGSGGLDLARVYQIVGNTLGETEDAFESIANVIYNSTEDQRSYLTALITEIAALEEELVKLQDEGLNTDEVLRQLAEKKQIVIEYTVRLSENIQVEQIKAKIKPTIEFDETTLTQFQKQLELAYALQKYELIEVQKLTPEEAQLLADSYETFFVLLKDGFREVSGVGQEYLQEAGKMLEEAGEIGTQQTTPFNIQSIDASSSAFKAAYNKMFEYITSTFPQYKPQTEEMGIIFKDNVTDVLHLDNLIMQLAMQELIDVNEKQLDGLYNLPSGAEFYVPIETLDYAYNAGLNKSAGGDVVGPEYAGTDYTQFAQGAADILQEAKDEIEQAIARAAEYPEPNADRGDDQYQLTPEERDYLSGRANPYVPNVPENPATITDEQRRLLSGPDYAGGYSTLLDDIKEFFQTLLYGKDETKQSIEERNIEELNKFLGKTGITKDKTEDITSLSQESTSQSIVSELQLLNSNVVSFLGLDVPKPFSLESQQTIPANFSTDTKNPSLSLSLDSMANINLIVDGRVLASVVSTYLYEDLLRFADVAGSISRRIVSV